MYQMTEERSLGELFSDLSTDTSLLIRQEIELAKAEMSEKASHAAKQAGIAGFGGALAYVGLFAIVAAVIALLALFIPIWIAALIVGIVVAAIGLLLVRQGASNLKKMDMAPRKTIDSIQEDKEWLKKTLS